MNEKIWCPECDVECQYLSDNLGGCPECGSRWTECPDCGDVVDVSEDWSVEQGVCRCCQISEDDVVKLFGLIDDPAKMFAYLEQLFGEPEPPAN